MRKKTHNIKHLKREDENLKSIKILIILMRLSFVGFGRARSIEIDMV
jgi:hypothetical protein